MKVTRNITIDLNNPRRQVVHLMQGENQREITLTLLKDGMPFDVSEGIGTATLVKVAYLVRWLNENQTRCEYGLKSSA